MRGTHQNITLTSSTPRQRQTLTRSFWCSFFSQFSISHATVVVAAAASAAVSTGDGQSLCDAAAQRRRVAHSVHGGERNAEGCRRKVFPFGRWCGDITETTVTPPVKLHSGGQGTGNNGQHRTPSYRLKLGGGRSLSPGASHGHRAICKSVE